MDSSVKRFDHIEDAEWLRKMKEKNFSYPAMIKKIQARQSYLKNREKILSKAKNKRKP